MLIFVNGSVNAGKTTVGRMLAEKLGYEFIDFDDIREVIRTFDLDKDIPKVISTGIEKINRLQSQNKNIVAAYVLRDQDYVQLQERVVGEKHFVTLAPELSVAISNRGERELSDWEMKRVKHHYKTNIHRPSFGEVIDNSHLTPVETVERICKLLSLPA